METIKTRRNVGQRFKLGATRECPYDVWVDDPLSACACEAIEELVREKNKLHRFYMEKIYHLSRWEAAKCRAVLIKL